MSKSTFVICFNALENRFFEVSAIHEVDYQYRANYYRLGLRLNFYDGDINVSNIDEMRKLCFRKITKMMTIQNMWQNHHSFYVIDYEIRTILRGANEHIQQNNNGSDRRVDDNDSDESENSNYVSSSSDSSGDSAYLSPTSVATTSSASDHLSNSSAYLSDEHS